MTELERFVRHFRPLQITPCAIPPNSTKEEVRDILTTFLQQPGAQDIAIETATLPDTPLKDTARLV